MKPFLLALFSLLIVTACATQQNQMGEWSPEKTERGKDVCSAMSKGNMPEKGRMADGCMDILDAGLAEAPAFWKDQTGKTTGVFDSGYQQILFDEINAAVARHDAIGGAAMVMDVSDGTILAAVSVLAESSLSFNYLSEAVFEHGSIFKIFSTAALLETQNVGMGYEFDAREPIKRGRFTINDYHAEKRILTIPEVFIYSSNIGAALMGEKVGTEKLREFYSDLGLDKPITTKTIKTVDPIYPKEWKEIDTLTSSYGHGLAVTPLHVVVATARIINGGKAIQPELPQAQDERAQAASILKPETVDKIRQLMRMSVSEGTGNFADIDGLEVGGKTGTAEKVRADGKGYDRKRLISSFIGFYPVSKPRYIVYVMLDEPKGTEETHGYATGGWVAAPVVGRIIKAMEPVEDMKDEEVKMGKVLAACILLAAQTYSVPPAVLLGIYKVKNGEAGQEYGPLPDGTYDLGPMKINTSKLPELAEKWEVDEKKARQWVKDDPCTNAGVTAWVLRSKLDETDDLKSAITLYNEGSEEENKAFKAAVVHAMQKHGLIIRPGEKADKGTL